MHVFGARGQLFRANPVIPLQKAGYTSSVILEPDESGRFMCRMFDEWSATQTDRIAVAPLNSHLLSLLYEQSAECQHRQTCVGSHVGVRPDGTLLLCRRFQTQCLGSVSWDAFEDIYAGAACRDVRQGKRLASDWACANREICHGGGPHNASVFAGDARASDPLCIDYQMINGHICRRIDVERNEAANHP